MPPDSSVRLPEGLLSRASMLNPENRSDVVRKALDIGLGEMEKKQLAEEAGNIGVLVKRLVNGLVEDKNSSLNRGIMGHVQNAAGNPFPPTLVLPMLPKHANGEEINTREDLPVFEIKAEQRLTLIRPAVLWTVYAPINVQIWSEDPEAYIEVSELRIDGEGENLLMPGWHPAKHFNGIATSLCRIQGVIAPSTLHIKVRSNLDTRISVRIICEAKRGGDVWRDDLPKPPAPTKFVRSSFIRVPFIRPKNGAPGRLETTPVNNQILRIHAVVFEGEHLGTTIFSDFKIGGSPDLSQPDGWSCALDHTKGEPRLKAYPILISPNVAFIDVQDVIMQETCMPYLLCEVMESF